MHQGIIKKFQKKICGKYGIQTYFKGNTTIKQTIMKPKDQDPKDNRSGLMHSYKCQDIMQGGVHRRDIKVPGGRGTRNISRDHHPSMCTSSTQGTMLHLTTST